MKRYTWALNVVDRQQQTKEGKTVVLSKGEEANKNRSGATVARTGSGYAVADDVDQLRCPFTKKSRAGTSQRERRKV